MPPDPFAPDPFALAAPAPFQADPFVPPRLQQPDPFAVEAFAAPPPPDPFQADPFAQASSQSPRSSTADPFDDAPWPPPSVPAPSAPAPDPFQPASRDPFQPQRSAFDPGMADPLDLGPRREAPRARVPAPVVTAGTGRLADAFASVFALVLQLRSTADFGDPGGLRERAEALLDRAVAQAAAQGASSADVREAEFCLVAFLDETLLMSDWPGRDGWAQRPLQLSRYERYDAGEAFFDRLRQLLSEGGRDETLEVYYLCIALGYKGRYQIHGREVLGQLVADLKGRLARAPGGTRPLAPHALPAGPAAAAEAGGIPTWALFAGAAALVLVLYLVLSVSVSGIARDVARDVSTLPVSGSAPVPSR